MNTLACSLVAHNSNDIIAAGPISHQSMCRPYRVVLRICLDLKSKKPRGYVVHNQIWEIDNPVEDLAAACADSSSSFSHGNYFQAHQFAEAVKCFCQRVEGDLQFVPKFPESEANLTNLTPSTVS